VTLRGASAWLIALVLGIAACGGAGAPAATPDESPSPDPTATPTATPTEPPPTPAAAGPPSDSCVNGWTSPPTGSPEHSDGLQVLSGFMAEDGPWQVDEMRYFTGPDAPWIIEPRYEVVHRWYIRARLADDPDYRGRWLVELRTDRINGVSAVAAYDTHGYESPDWHGFVGEGQPTKYPGLPGSWSGINYDFVTGEGDHDMPGLPDEVVGCLEGT
jgi:hypothetical protein